MTGERFPMRVVARMTGLAPATIRAWERSYDAVVPERTSGNTRRYTADDVRRLTFLKDLVDNGHAISGIAHLDEDGLLALRGGPPKRTPERETAELVVDDDAPDVMLQDIPRPTDTLSFDAIRDAYLNAVTRLDTRRASEILLRVATLLDVRDVVFRLIVPVMQEVGTRWSHAELGVAQEHLVSAQLRGLVSSLLRLSPSDRGARRVLMTTPAGHRHEFGILAAALLAAGRGVETVYLGPDLPDEELEWSVRLSKSDVLVLSVVKDMGKAERQRLAGVLEQVHAEARVWIGLPEGHPFIQDTPFARHFHDFESIDYAFANWGV